MTDQKTNQFLYYVATGQQKAAQTMLIEDPSLALKKGDVTDLGKHCFKDITAFQYALWALDWHMWTMILKYLPKDEALAQFNFLESQGPAAHYNFEGLTNALVSYIDNYNHQTFSKNPSKWKKVVRNLVHAQQEVPAHVANEYCRPNRSFQNPTFTEKSLPRLFGLAAKECHWFESSKELLPVWRGILADLAVRGELDNEIAATDWAAIVSLRDVRLKQLADLKAQLNQTQTNTTPISPIQQLLMHVARGEQDAAEEMIKTNPKLLFEKDSVTDYSNRTFDNITPFQYAIWALDWRMWTMILKYLPKSEASQQLNEQEKLGSQSPHGAHYSFNDLIVPLYTYQNQNKDWDYNQQSFYWRNCVGGAQARVPAHVAQEYCNPDHSFENPNFTEENLTRTLKYDNPYFLGSTNSTWFEASATDNELGVDFAIERGCKIANGGAQVSYTSQDPSIDLAAIILLSTVRNNQLLDLRNQLSLNSREVIVSAPDFSCFENNELRNEIISKLHAYANPGLFEWALHMRRFIIVAQEAEQFLIKHPEINTQKSLTEFLLQHVKPQLTETNGEITKTGTMIDIVNQYTSMDSQSFIIYDKIGP